MLVLNLNVLKAPCNIFWFSHATRQPDFETPIANKSLI